MIELNDPILFKKRDTYVLLSESHQVVNGKVQLQEVPDNFQRVTITTTGTWIETDEEISSTDRYKVDYATGIITVDSSHNGTALDFSYYGTGIIVVPYSRIWTQESNGEVSETLDEKIISIDQKNNELEKLQSTYRNNVYDEMLIWKQYVNTYSDISTTFPDPRHGWTTYVLDTNYVYRYNEDELDWIAIQKINTSGEVHVDTVPPNSTNSMWIDTSE